MNAATEAAPQTRHRSPAAEAVWKAFACGRERGWKHGRLTADPATDDEPGMFRFPDSGMQGPPDWIAGLVASLDANLPPPENILDALDDDSLTLPESPPAFRMPTVPDPEDAGLCIAAARIVAACGHDVLPPFFVTEEDMLAQIEEFTWNALMIGGEEAFIVASSILSDPSTFATRREPSDIEGIETED